MYIGGIQMYQQISAWVWLNDQVQEISDFQGYICASCMYVLDIKRAWQTIPRNQRFSQGCVELDGGAQTFLPNDQRYDRSSQVVYDGWMARFKN